MKKRKNRKNNGQKLPWTTTLMLFVMLAAIGYGAKWLNARRQCEATGILTATEADALLHPATNPGLVEEIVEYEGMTVSFNRELHIPNWVSWELLGSEVDGNTERSNKFHTDPNVTGCATPDDYKGTGYDRGHMAPAADMKWSETAMQESFTMTNICPQLHSLNGGAWKKLEEKCRLKAMADSAIIIIAGPVATDEFDEYIGRSEVAVPKRFFKVVLSPWSNPPTGIGFIMDNGKIPGGLQTTAVTIDEVESITGHDFFAALPDSIEQIVESQCRFNAWSNAKPKK